MPFLGADPLHSERRILDPNAVSTGFMIGKTLVDDIIGNAQGWNPNGVKTDFGIIDSDYSGTQDTTFVDVTANNSFGDDFCKVSGKNPEGNIFGVRCELPP